MIGARTSVTRVNRRAVLGAAAGIVAGTAALGTTVIARPARAQARAGRASLEAGAWPTWVLDSGRELRLPPPDETKTPGEIVELQTLAAQRDGATRDRIGYWATGAPAYRWIERAIRHTQSRSVLGNRAGRMLALLSVAIYDGTVAAWDSKQAHLRPRPSERAPALTAAITNPAGPSYPDEVAVTAGAASTVLAYVFPQDAATFTTWAEEAVGTRIEAGVAYRSDVTAGLDLGRQVGERVVAWGRADGSDAVWSGSVPAGPGMWTGTNPVEPLGGIWKPWSLSVGSQFRPGPPPAVDSEQMAQELAEVKNVMRTNLTNLTASFWEYYGGRGSFEYWNDHASRKIFEYGLDDDPPQASRVYALVNIAYHDALIACWDTKFTYWSPRPSMLDPTITTVFVTPNHPSYPSAHSSIAGGAGGMLGRLFPRDAPEFERLAKEIGEARIMGGIHFRTDVDVGLRIGQQVAEAVWRRAGVATSP